MTSGTGRDRHGARVFLGSAAIPRLRGGDQDIVEEDGRTRVTHTLELTRLRGGWLATRALIVMHDWAVEAMLDRLGEALRTGTMPRHTTRPLPWLARLLFTLNRAKRSARPALA